MEPFRLEPPFIRALARVPCQIQRIGKKSSVDCSKIIDASHTGYRYIHLDRGKHDGFHSSSSYLDFGTDDTHMDLPLQ